MAKAPQRIQRGNLLAIEGPTQFGTRTATLRRQFDSGDVLATAVDGRSIRNCSHSYAPLVARCTMLAGSCGPRRFRNSHVSTSTNGAHIAHEFARHAHATVHVSASDSIGVPVYMAMLCPPTLCARFIETAYVTLAVNIGHSKAFADVRTPKLTPTHTFFVGGEA